ncbi:MAG TPA: hypothetical protein VNZ47_11940 [Candidatus Dormibacteraeota bacterium]|jgi:hypothetical protein|nr:hypothetical protein [Candidatus Dormibacteraeota bacterium]
MTEFFYYLAFGAASGVGVVFFANNRCPTYGEMLVGFFVGAVAWPIGLIVGIIAVLAMTIEKILHSQRCLKFRRWLNKPICKRSAQSKQE